MENIYDKNQAVHIDKATRKLVVKKSQDTTKILNDNKIARNLVDYEAGKTILETAIGIIKQQNIKQKELF